MQPVICSAGHQTQFIFSGQLQNSRSQYIRYQLYLDSCRLVSWIGPVPLGNTSHPAQHKSVQTYTSSLSSLSGSEIDGCTTLEIFNLLVFRKIRKKCIFLVLLNWDPILFQTSQYVSSLHCLIHKRLYAYLPSYVRAVEIFNAGLTCAAVLAVSLGRSLCKYQGVT